MSNDHFGKRGFGPAPPTCKGVLHRCWYCKAIVLPDRACGECGSRRTQIAWKISDKEMFDAVAAGYEPDPASFIYQPDTDAKDMLRAGLRPGMNDD